MKFNFEFAEKISRTYSDECRPLCHELKLPQTAFDILMFLANNPEYKTARDIVEIKAKCRRLATQGEGLGLVIIDYLQLIDSSSRYSGSRQQEVSEISRALKTMALELEVPVIALSQLSRSVEKREDKKPVLSDLRESGSIEQDADIVAALHAPDVEVPVGDEVPNPIQLIILKHRNGPTKTIDLLFKKKTSTFLSIRKENGASAN